MRNQIRAEISALSPFDDIEKTHRSAVLSWIDSGAQLCRTEKPATPPEHLVSYFVLVDDGSILLVDHRNAELWLPTGGHVEPDEHPRETVVREALEELGIRVSAPETGPLLVTRTETVGHTKGHVDISLWYVIQADRCVEMTFDSSEFSSVRWFPVGEVPVERTDPHMTRFLAKLQTSGLGM